MARSASFACTFVRTAALCAFALAGAVARAQCSNLDGTYEYQSVAPRNGIPEYLSNLAHGPEKAKLFVREGAAGPKGLAQQGPMARPRIRHLATRARLAYGAAGTKLHFLDAQGKPIAALGIDFPDRWACRNGRLERRGQRTSGLGDVLRTERVEETLARDAAGDLVYTETVTTVDPPGGPAPRRSEARFRLAQAIS